MKTYGFTLLALMVLFETLAFTVFEYPKSTSWWVANVVLIGLNILSVAMIENATEAVPDKWKIYLPAFIIIAFILLTVLPQAATFSK